MNQLATTAILLVLGQIVSATDPKEQKPEKAKRYESAEKKIRFDYPAGFVIGRYDSTADRTGFFTPGIVVIEKSRLADADLQKLKIGSEVVAIIPLKKKDSTFWRALGTDDAAFWSVSKIKPKRVKIGPHTAIKLPGFPGPYGDEALVYLIERPDRTIVLVMGHKRFTDDARTATGYQKVIEGIIKTVVFLK